MLFPFYHFMTEKQHIKWLPPPVYPHPIKNPAKRRGGKNTQFVLVETNFSARGSIFRKVHFNFGA